METKIPSKTMPRQKQFYYYFNINEWEGDSDRLKMSRANSDTWHSVINIMYKTKRATIEGTRDHLAKMLKLTPEEFDDFFEDLRTSGTATKAVIVNLKIDGRKAAQYLRKSCADVAQMSAQRRFFAEFLPIYRIFSRNVEEKLKGKKSEDLPEDKKLRKKLRGTNHEPARNASKELIVNKLRTNSSSEAEEETNSLTSQADTFRPPKGKTRRQVCEEISRDPKYKHIGGPGAIEHELKKLERWCSINRCHPSLKKFKESWLDRIWPKETNGNKNGNGSRNGTAQAADAGGRNGQGDRESAEDVARRIGAEIR